MNADTIIPITTGVFQRNEGQISTRLGDEAVILSVTSGEYFTLDPVGADLWEQLATPRSFEELVRHLLDTYDVEAERAERDLAKLLRDLLETELLVRAE